MNAIVKAIDALNTLLRYLAAFSLAVMTIIITYQIVIRLLAPYLDVQLPRWTEEIARYAMIWSVFIGSALAVRYSALIGVEAVFERLNEKMQKMLRLIVSVISIFFFVILIIFGFEMLSHVSSQLSPGMKLPMWIPYAAIPFGGFFMLLNSIAVFIETLQGETNREFFKGSE